MRGINLLSIALLVVAVCISQQQLASAELTDVQLLQECKDLCSDVSDLECASCLFAEAGSPVVAKFLAAISKIRVVNGCDKYMSPGSEYIEMKKIAPRKENRNKRKAYSYRYKVPNARPSTSSKEESSSSTEFKSTRKSASTVKTSKSSQEREQSSLSTKSTSTRKSASTVKTSRSSQQREQSSSSTKSTSTSKSASTVEVSSPQGEKYPPWRIPKRGYGRRSVGEETEDGLFNFFVSLIGTCGEQCIGLSSCKYDHSPCVECLIKGAHSGVGVRYMLKHLKGSNN